MATEKRLIEIDALIDNIDWDNDLQKWVLRSEPEDIPTVDAVEVVHGRWRIIDFKGNVECSKCGYTMDLEYKYCPNCGAKMDGERKDHG